MKRISSSPLKWITLVFIYTYHCIAQADFKLGETTPPGEYYGNSQSDEFRRAMHPDDEITPQEQAEIDYIVPQNLSDRWFVKLRLNQGTVKFDSIKNKSKLYTGGEVVNKKVKKDQTAFELGVGYASGSWRLEVEYIHNSSITYKPPVVYQGTGIPNLSLDGKITTFPILAKGYYDFGDFYLFRPYIGLGIGLSSNEADGTLILNGATVANKKIRLLGYFIQGEVGTRFRILDTKFLLDFGYRTGFLGPAKFVLDSSQQGDVRLEGRTGLSGFYFGLAYMI